MQSFLECYNCLTTASALPWRVYCIISVICYVAGQPGDSSVVCSSVWVMWDIMTIIMCLQKHWIICWRRKWCIKIFWRYMAMCILCTYTHTYTCMYKVKNIIVIVIIYTYVCMYVCTYSMYLKAKHMYIHTYVCM